MFHSLRLLSQAPLARGSCALPSVLFHYSSSTDTGAYNNSDLVSSGPSNSCDLPELCLSYGETTEPSDPLTSNSEVPEACIPSSSESEDSSDETTHNEANTSRMAGDMYSVVSSGDFGLVVILKTERNLTGNEKYFLLNHHFISKSRGIRRGGGSGDPPFFKLIIFIAWLGMHV